jgi:hypothetical protein
MRPSRIKKYKQKQKNMGFEFKTDQDTTPAVVEETLTQITYLEGEEGKLAIQFLEETGLYQKFLLWQGLQMQLKDLQNSLYIGKGLLD